MSVRMRPISLICMLVSTHERVAEVPLILLNQTPVNYTDTPGICITRSINVTCMVSAVEDTYICEAVSTVGYRKLVEAAEEVALTYSAIRITPELEL